MSLNHGLKEHIRKVKSGEIERSKHIDPIEKSKRNPGSFKLAINAKCYDCCCGQKTEVKYCSVRGCPLYNLRPWQTKEISDTLGDIEGTKIRSVYK
ncbi:MAG: hypothetical protein GY705_28785 [Bacteroidetes bacterium]|nr:hypothetical protein [Bacteroidota bacterium]